MNLKKLLATVVKAATPVAKVMLPAVAVAIVTHTSVKAALRNVVLSELSK